MTLDNQISLGISNDFKLPKKLIIFRDIIIDRGSKYTVVGGYVETKEELSDFMKYLLKDKYFQKSTHNSYGYRLRLLDNGIIEGKNDDGEVGAGMCILRELQRENATNLVLVVTRYFGGIKLQNDRFKNVIDSCKIFFERIKG